MFFIFPSGKVVLPSFIFLPAGEIAALHFNTASVQYQHMVHTGVQQIPVMGYQNKSFLARQIGFHALPGVLIQVIGRLINQQKIIFPGKEHRQHNLGPLSKAQSFKRTV